MATPLYNAALRAPGLGLLALEFRAPFDFGAVVPAWPLLLRAPRADGHHVLVVPGLAAGDPSTLPLRGYISSLGYVAEGWAQGFNFGPREGVLDTARRSLDEAFRRSGRKVSLVGWSRGGVYARVLAKEAPDQVRSGITLGSPFAGPPKSTDAWRVYELATGMNVEAESGKYELHVAPPVPTTSIYSRTDGIVAWRGSLQDPAFGHNRIENIEVVASHIGMGLNPGAWWAIADRLSQAEGWWRPFEREGLLGLKGLVYPDPHRP